MKRFFCSLLGFVVTGLVLLATVSSASACVLGHYQPRVPESLQK